jgi:hypothetical protein
MFRLAKLVSAVCTGRVVDVLGLSLNATALVEFRDCR